MPDSFYDSNQGYCLCKQLARLCTAEQLRRCRRAEKVGPLPQAEQEIAGLELGTRAVGITGMPALSAVM